MENKEAIDILDNMIDVREYSRFEIQALNQAIKALEIVDRLLSREKYADAEIERLKEEQKIRYDILDLKKQLDSYKAREWDRLPKEEGRCPVYPRKYYYCSCIKNFCNAIM